MVQLTCRGVNLGKVSPTGNSDLAFALQAEAKSSPFFTSDGTEVTSDIKEDPGALTITFGSSPAARRCTFQLTPAELQTLAARVENLRPRSWMECYSLANVGTHCCDLIRTNLTLSARNGGDLYITSWLTGSELPQDLRDLIETLKGPAGVDSRYRQLCATQ